MKKIMENRMTRQNETAREFVLTSHKSSSLTEMKERMFSTYRKSVIHIYCYSNLVSMTVLFTADFEEV